LSYNHLTPAEFEFSLRDDLLIDKLRQLFRSGAKVSSEEVEQLYRRQKEKISLDMVKLDPQDFVAAVKVNEKDLEDYFADHREDFRVPEKRDVVALKIDSRDLEKQVEVNDQDIAAYYDDHLGDYVVPEQVKARHILFKVDPEAPASAWNEAEKKARDIFTALHHLKHNKHEVLLFHVTEKTTEYDFEFADRPHEFVDLETKERLKITPPQIRDQYIRHIKEYVQELKMRCGQFKIDFIEADIHQPVDKVLISYLIKRKKMR
jgi:hypothetical protein